MNFHAIGRQLRSIVSPLRKSQLASHTCVQTAPAPHARVHSVGADNRPGLNRTASHDRAIGDYACYWRVPQQLDAALFCAGDHFLVQDSSAHADPALRSESCFCESRTIDEANAAEDLSVTVVNADIQFAECCERAGKKAFAALGELDVSIDHSDGQI